jgi:hypothetical protein
METNMKRKACRMVAVGVSAMIAVALASSCTSTSRLRNTEVTGFLGDYSKLAPGGADKAQLVYINPDVNWMAYSRVIIEPITVYSVPGNPLAELPREQLIALASYLHATLSEELSKSYQIVGEPGSGVMRLRVALTEAGAGRPVMGVASTLTPPGLALSALKKAATGKATGTGSARVEMELLDAQTGERLAAAVDGQTGDKVDFFGSFSKWDDAQDAFDHWAAQMRSRLLDLRVGRE